MTNVVQIDEAQVRLYIVPRVRSTVTETFNVAPNMAVDHLCSVRPYERVAARTDKWVSHYGRRPHMQVSGVKGS